MNENTVKKKDRSELVIGRERVDIQPNPVHEIPLNSIGHGE
jgi:hypothetical protein